ncbi:MAG: hypothetical protein NT145_04305 [Elusimicrobia bacterium]|nr:hypothetical protein [Elusimicrobiota bacterium]
MDFFPADEIKRKLFHLLTLIYIILYWVTPVTFMLVGLGVTIILVFLFEIVRLKHTRFNYWLLSLLGGVHRGHETDKISGMAFTLAGSFFTILLFFGDRNIVMASFMYLAFGDTSAALIGRAFGKHKITKDKTYEGSIACFIVCLICGLFFLEWPIAILGAVIATLIELIPWPISDNFWIPLVASGTLIFLVSTFRF